MNFTEKQMYSTEIKRESIKRSYANPIGTLYRTKDWNCTNDVINFSLEIDKMENI